MSKANKKIKEKTEVEKSNLKVILENCSGGLLNSNKEHQIKSEGITLIALVLTIVILIILATITINFAFGENGLVSMTEDARDITTEATEKEGIEMAVADSKIKDITTPDREKENLEESLRSQFGNDANFTVTENGDGSFLINMNDSQRSYYVESTGEIIAQSEMIEIGTAEELKAFRDEVNSGNSYEGKYIRLTSNITLDSGEEWEPIGLYPMENSSPDAETNKPFSGIFDGKGYEINGLYINTTNKVQGLFGLVIGGTIKNVGIGKNCNITGNISIGAVAGYLYNNSSAFNCYNKSNLVVGSYSGGLFGQVIKGSQVENCYNDGNVISNVGTVSIGGIVGNFSNSQISKCYNSGKIECEEVSYMGGIVGQMASSTIDNSFNLGNITGKQHVGGIAGQIYNNALLQNCYNTGNVSGSDLIGGILGMNSSEIYNCYNIGNISGNTSAIRWNSRYKYG